MHGERERKRGRRRGALLLDNLFSYRASSRLRLDKCSDGCVWGENSRGWLVECWRGDTGKEREGKTEREMDHPVSACIMEKREADEPNWKWDLQAAFHTHIHAHYKWSKAKKVDHKKVTGDSNWVIWPQCCHSGGHYSAYRCITAVTFASANQWDPARLDSFGAASTAVAPCSPVATPSSQQLWKAQLGNNLLLASQLSATPAWLHDVLQTLLAGVERMDCWPDDCWPDEGLERSKL